MKTAELKVCCICVLFYVKQFSILYKLLWKVRVSILVFEFHGHLELFVRLNSVVKVPGWMNDMQFSKRWSNMDSTKNNSTEQFSWPSSSMESMGISSLASVGFSSSLLRILYTTPTSDSKLSNMQYVTWSNNHQKKILGWSQRPVEISCHGRLKVYLGTA